jgi:4-amino-4-deoxy-L-arabinose transferase-like glycosyltransferase
MTSMAIRRPEVRTSAVPPLAMLPVLVIAGLAGALLLVTSVRYAHGFDELYFVMAGRNHVDWGYFDQPPLVPLLAGGMDRLFPGSLVMLRLPVTLAGAAGVVITALMARELGGGRAAQSIAAGAYATSGVITFGHWLGTYALDPLWWTLLFWLVVRWVRLHSAGLRDDRPLLWAGIVTAVSLQTKFLVPAFWVFILLSAAVLGPRELLRRPLLWTGAAIATVTTLPTLLWQATHGWPYLRMSDVVSAEFPGTWSFLGGGLIGAGVAAGGVAFLYGLWRLLRSPELRPYRFVGVAVVALIAAFLLSRGRAYYLLSVYSPLFAAGAVELLRRDLVSWWKAAVWPVFALSAAVTIAALPIYPESMLGKVPDNWAFLPSGAAFAQGELPAQELGTAVGTAYAALPAAEKARTAVYSDLYPFAAAAEFYGRDKGITRVYSGHRGYWYFGPPPESAEDALFVGLDPSVLRPHFAAVTEVVPGTVWLFSGRMGTWASFWPAMERQ